MNYAVAALLLLLLLALLRPLSQSSTEKYSSGMDVTEKRKNILQYLALVQQRSGQGQWTTAEDDAFAALLFMLDAKQDTSHSLYVAQTILKSKNGWTGTVDGVTTPAFTAAVQKYVAALDPAIVGVVGVLRNGYSPAGP